MADVKIDGQTYTDVDMLNLEDTDGNEVKFYTDEKLRLDYSKQITNKPKINGVELNGDLTPEELGLSVGGGKPYEKVYETELTESVSELYVDLTKKLYTEADIRVKSFTTNKDGTTVSNTASMRVFYGETATQYGAVSRLSTDVANSVGSSTDSREIRMHIKIDELGLCRGIIQNTGYSIATNAIIIPIKFSENRLKAFKFVDGGFSRLFSTGTQVEVWAR